MACRKQADVDRDRHYRDRCPIRSLAACGNGLPHERRISHVSLDGSFPRAVLSMLRLTGGCGRMLARVRASIGFGLPQRTKALYNAAPDSRGSPQRPGRHWNRQAKTASKPQLHRRS
jgi:hypothetical protein